MTDRPTVTGVVETGVYVEDLDRSVRFYQNLFGFEVEIHDPLICVLRVPGRQALILFPKRIADEPGRTSSPAGTVQGMIPPHGGSGRSHFAFAIPAGEVEKWESHLAERKIEIEGKVHWKRGGWSLYFRDPDGNLVELISPGLWSFY